MSERKRNGHKRQQIWTSQTSFAIIFTQEKQVEFCSSLSTVFIAVDLHDVGIYLKRCLVQIHLTNPFHCRSIV